MFGRGKTRTHSELMRDELAESYGHFKTAAGHVVGGTTEKVTPTYDRAVVVAGRGWQSTKSAFAPLADQIRTGAANARNGNGEITVSKSRRWPVLAGLLAAGMAVGAAGAVAMRRRRAAAQWEEYEPSRALDDAEAMLDETTGSPGRMSAATKKVQAGAASIAESVSTKTSKLAESLNEKSGRQGSYPTNPERIARDAGQILDEGKPTPADLENTSYDRP